MEADPDPARDERRSGRSGGSGGTRRALGEERRGARSEPHALIVIDASAAIELVLATPSGVRISEDLAREAPTLMPAHFEADAYAGLRRMVTTGIIQREALPTALTRVAELPGDRVPLAPLLPAAYELFDRVGAHDAFYVVLALGLNATLLTSDGPLARAAAQIGVNVLLRPPEAIG